MDLSVGGATQTRTGTLSAGTGTITYSSSDTNVATVNASTGEVSPVGAGTCTITASVPATGQYAAAEASYTVNVTDPNNNSGTINFNSSGTVKGTIKISTDSESGQDNLGNTWVVTTVGTTSFTPQPDYCQVGSSNKPATSITFTMSLPATAKFNTFSAKFGGFSSTAGTVTLSVDGTQVGTGNLNGTNDVTVEATGVPKNGQTLTVTVTSISKGVKCYYISYTYGVVGSDPTVSLDETDLSIEVGETATLTATTTNPSGAAVTWSTSNSSVATVSGGVVTAVAPGTATITAALASDATVKATCAVTVTAKARTITMDTSDMELTVGGASQTRPGTLSAGTGTITYSSSDTDVATVNASTGEVTPVGEGSCTITASVPATGLYAAAEASYTVNVTDPNNMFFTWDLTTNEYKTAEAASVVWTSTFASMTVEKGSSSTAANNYLGGTGSYTHTRFYSGQSLTITPALGYRIKKVEFTCTSESYKAGFYGNDWTNAAATNDGAIVTVTPTSGTNAMSVTISSVVRCTYVTVYYASIGALTPSDLSVTSTLQVSEGGTADIEYTTSSTGTMTYTSNDTDVATVDANGRVTGVAVGTTTISVSQAADGTYAASEVKTVTVTVVADVADGSYVLVETEPADWSGTYLIVNAADATAGTGMALDGSLSESALSSAGNGRTVTITAKKIPATASTNASSFVVAKSGSDYSVKSASGVFIGRDAASNGMDTDTETAFLNTFSLTSDGVVEIAGEGGKHIAYNSSVSTFKYYTMTANVYLYKKTSESGDELITPTIAFDAPKTLTKKVGDSWTKAATTTSTAKPHYSSSDSKIVKVINATTGEMKALKRGTVTITANVPENETYASAEDTYTVTVNKGDNDLALTSNSAVTLGTSTSAYTITYSTSSTGAITWTSSDETIATVAQGSGKTGIVTLTGKVGTVTIRFSQSADDDYEASAGNQTVTITVSASGSNVAYYYRLSGGTVPTGATGTKYLLVCEDKGKAADSYTLGALANAGDVTGKRRSVPVLDVTIVDDRIEATTRLDQAMYLFTGSGSEFQLKSSRNTYIGDTDFQGCSKPEEVANGLSEVDEDGYFVGTSEVAPAMYNTVTIEDGNLVIEGGGLAPSVGGTTVHRYLRYNESSAFFRYYRYDSGVQQKLALYKRIDAGDKFVQFIPRRHEMDAGDTWVTNIVTQNTTGTPTYESLNPAVATVDPVTGVVTAVAAGTADIKVTVDGVENYANVSVKSSGSTLSRYVKVTQTSDLENGDYLIVYENSATEGYVMDGSQAMSNGNAVAKTSTNAVIEDDVERTGVKAIVANAAMDACNFTLAMKYSGSNVYHTVRSHSGYYIGKQTAADGLDVNPGSSYNNTLTAPGGTTSFKGQANTYLKYNTSDETFQFYTTGQSVVELYKKEPYNYNVYVGSSTPSTMKADIAGPGLLAPNAMAVYTLPDEVAEDEVQMENIINEVNVVVNGTTKNFVVTDKQSGVSTNKGYTNFYAPAEFTKAEKVSYARSGVCGFNSVCLPFSYTVEQAASMFGADAEIYVLESVTDGAVNFVKKTDSGYKVAAGKPVIIKTTTTTEWNIDGVAGTFDVNGAAPVEDPKTDGTRKATLKGAYQTLTINTGDASETGHTYYKLNSTGDYFVKVPANAKVYPFRVYLDVETLGAAPAPAQLSVRLIDGGDFVMDPSVSIADVTTLVNMLLGKGNVTTTDDGVHYVRPTDGQKMNADWDGDGQVSISDVTKLVNKVLKK